MQLFKSKYRTRIEAKIVELAVERAFYKDREVKAIHELNQKDRVHFIVLRGDCESKIKLLKSLL